MPVLFCAFVFENYSYVVRYDKKLCISENFFLRTVSVTFIYYVHVLKLKGGELNQ